MRTHAWLAVVLLLSPGCGGDDGPNPDGGDGPDADPLAPDAPPAGADAATPDGSAACGSEVLPTADIQDTEGLAIAPDGTLYYSQSQSVGRRPPGGAAEDQWVSIPGANTMWGLSLTEDGMLYVASPSGTGTIYVIDTTAVTPSATTFLSNAGGANGTIIGPDGVLYYSDFNAGRVYRVPAAETRTEVTATPVPAANGIFFESPTSLLVLAYSAGEIRRLTLDGSMHETARELVTAVPGNPSLDGIARDDLGRWYLGDNGNGELIRLDSSFANPETLLTNVPAAANIVFGKGALVCTDVYVASSGTLGRFIGDAPGTP